jgi:hypothetical protein
LVTDLVTGLHTRHGSRKNQNPSIFLATYYLSQLIVKIWQFEIIFSSKSSEFRSFFHVKSLQNPPPPQKHLRRFFSKKRIYDRICCFKAIGSSFGDISPQKKTGENFKQAKGLKGSW